MTLILSEDAVHDLRKISRCTRRTYGKAQAKSHIEQIEHCCGALVAGRFRGRVAGHVSKALCKQRVASHFVFFRIL